VSARIYVIPLSNPAAAGAAMVAHKRLPHRVVSLPPGFHPLLVRAAGFAGPTVPALDVDGRKLQGTMEISRALDELVPERPLFPRDPAERARVEEAERFGHFELQPVPRRVFRWALLQDPDLRTWLGRDVLRLPAPGLMGTLSMPTIRALAAKSEADEAHVTDDLRCLPERLDRVDALLAEGTIGGPEPNAADYQILATVRVLLEIEDLAGAVAGRPCEAAARRLYPDWAGPMPRTSVLDGLV
jgi:glutathione S-transferase